MYVMVGVSGRMVSRRRPRARSLSEYFARRVMFPTISSLLRTIGYEVSPMRSVATASSSRNAMCEMVDVAKRDVGHRMQLAICTSQSVVESVWHK